MSDQTSREFKHDDELVDEASWESFPASDPPAFNSGVADLPDDSQSEEDAADVGEDAAGRKSARQGSKDDKSAQ